MNRFLLDKQLEKTLIGKMYFLKQSNFNKLLNSIKLNEYSETFRLNNNKIGQFNCKIINNNIRYRDLWSYDAKLKIYNTFNNYNLLNEDLQIIKKTLRIKELAEISHQLFLNSMSISIQQIPKDLYHELLNKSDKDIISFE